MMIIFGVTFVVRLARVLLMFRLGVRLSVARVRRVLLGFILRFMSFMFACVSLALRIVFFMTRLARVRVRSAMLTMTLLIAAARQIVLVTISSVAFVLFPTVLSFVIL